jgi:hypothetical protein
MTHPDKSSTIEQMAQSLGYTLAPAEVADVQRRMDLIAAELRWRTGPKAQLDAHRLDLVKLACREKYGK